MNSADLCFPCRSRIIVIPIKIHPKKINMPFLRNLLVF